MGLGRNQLAIVTDGLEERTVFSALPVVLSDVVALGKPTTIYADEIVVSSEAGTNGFPLNLVCRILRFTDGGRINTDGPAGIPNFPADQRHESPHSPGADGLDGDDGGKGSPAGAVTISAQYIVGEVKISAVGGPGGRPRDGGHGQPGGQGPAGVDVHVIEDVPTLPQCNGGQGRPGGKAGLPGNRGAGGNGGQVSINVLDEAFILPPNVVDVAHGKHGDAGQGGRPGVGGPGGPGGRVRIRICEPSGPRFHRDSLSQSTAKEPDPSEVFWLQGNESELGNLQNASEVFALGRDYCFTSTLRHGVSGNQGPAGDIRGVEVSERQKEPNGQSGEINLKTVSESFIAELFDGPALEILACAVEDEYRGSGGNVDDALRHKIEFLLLVCVHDDYPSALKKEVLARAYSMARKVALGLDFYGFSRERAPLLSFETYSRLISDSVLPQARIVEESFNGYWDAQQDAEKQRKQIKVALQSAQARALGLEVEYDRVTDETRARLAQLPALDAKVNAAEELLRQREAELNSAIKKKNDSCDLMKTFIAVGTIVVGVSTGGAGFIAAASAGQKLYQDYTDNNDSISDLWDERKLIGDDLKELGKGAKDVASGLAAIQEGIKNLTPEHRKVPQFRMERESFDKVAKDFADIPEAVEYREAGYDFLKCVENRNQAILDYNSQLVQLVEMQAQVAAGKRATIALQSVITGAADPAEAYIISVMSRIYLDTLAIAASMVHSEKKALAYHFARPMDAPLSALNVATITYAHQKILMKDWVSAKERYEARQELEPGLLTLNLKSLVSVEAWRSFKSTGLISFTIRRNHPEFEFLWEGLPGVRITGMELVLDGARVAVGQKQIPWIMSHGGSELIYKEDGKPIAFSHRAVAFRGFTSLTGEKPMVRPDFSETNLYAGLSPFASWLLALSPSPILGLDLKGLTDIEIKLSGYIILG